MKAVTIKEPANGYFDIKDVTLRPIEAGEALVDMEYCGVCHTDLLIASGAQGEHPGRITGHEGVGIVREVAPDVTSVKPGDRVSIAWLFAGCGHCEYCEQGLENLCRNRHESGFDVDGAMAQQAIVKADWAVKVPAGLDPVKATSITCAGVTSYKAIKESNTKPGDWIVVYGAGGLGNLAVQYAKNVFNLNVISVDIFDEKLALAKDAGADLVYNASNNDSPQFVHEHLPEGVAAAIVTAPAATVFDQAANVVKAHGTVVAVGMAAGNMEMSIAKMIVDGTQVKGTLTGTRNDLAEAFMYASKGLVSPITSLRRMSDINKIVDQMHAGKIQGRAVIDIKAEA
ncbi:zinc-dependent alcohol dehydrogenase [Secundilactobacillus paracollinoides]|uniref:alcohol dehydrogenase AdhP n=1 Tax=Secundilactobacillus paracollinoides TaxID=240427 RepID=UPI0006D28CA2|nr:alcohol dehydrogenase AdhP [Secundilactobacillus paracollinoides]ANZ65130.1 zinc-dependent alcohol dehydrogenase [Secundilactobacillus paracollinoides]KRL79163.1 alcohol dehydrogenase [Secundilactobacillus paracollinoides DSM 15502 = JCM 11969]